MIVIIMLINLLNLLFDILFCSVTAFPLALYLPIACFSLLLAFPNHATRAPHPGLACAMSQEPLTENAIKQPEII